MDRSGSEYMCIGGSAIFDGPTGTAAVAAMVGWHINAVRLPLNEDCWLGINGVRPAGTPTAYGIGLKDHLAALASAATSS